MNVYLGLGRWPKSRRSAVTIGNFVGVHLGHRAILKRLGMRAAKLRAQTTVVTFRPHPQLVLRGEAPCALATHERNLELLSDAGVENLVMLRFTPALSRVEPEDFIERILVRGLGAKTVVVGADFRFGHFARGDIDMLRAFGRRLGVAVEGVRVARLEGKRLSSTAIRHALAEGDLEWANKALGRPHLLMGKVVAGSGRGGKTLGFPTANIAVDAGTCLPRLGIYAGRMVIARKQVAAAISVGTNPQFGGREVSVEAHLLDFNGRLYGKRVGLEIVARIRDEKVFPSESALVKAIASDVEETRRLVAVERQGPVGKARPRNAR